MYVSKFLTICVALTLFSELSVANSVKTRHRKSLRHSVSVRICRLMAIFGRGRCAFVWISWIQVNLSPVQVQCLRGSTSLRGIHFVFFPDKISHGSQSSGNCGQLELGGTNIQSRDLGRGGSVWS